MEKQMQIPRSMFTDVQRLLIRLEGVEVDKDTRELLNAIEGQINAKLRANKKRELYSKAIEGDEESRQAYLDEVGVRKSFRWDAEYEAERKGGRESD